MLNATYGPQSNGSETGDGALLCTTIDLAFEQSWDLRDDARALTTPGVAFSSTLCVASILSLFFGARLAPFVAALLASFLGFSLSYALVRQFLPLECATGVAIAGVCGLLCVLAVACFYRLALYTLGFSCAAAIVHLVFAAMPGLHGDFPRVRDKSILYWGVLNATGTLAGVVVRRYRTSVLEAVTAIVGGIGFAFALHGFTSAVLQHRWLSVLVAGIAAAVGWIYQRKSRARRTKERTDAEHK